MLRAWYLELLHNERLGLREASFLEVKGTDTNVKARSSKMT